MNGVVIVKEQVEAWYVDEDGNRTPRNDIERYFLRNRKGDVVSNQYLCMISLGDDHFAVCDLVSEATFWSNYNEYDIIGGEYETSTPKMKWGIIRISRDAKGNVIPRGEVMVVTYLYDRISSNNLKTATVKYNDKYTYLDLDINRTSYGKQLVPCKLDHAVPFCVDIERFAECSIDDTVGYLPRECAPRENLEASELLTKEQAMYVARNLRNGDNTEPDNFGAISRYLALTGIRIQQPKRFVLGEKGNH